MPVSQCLFSDGRELTFREMAARSFEALVKVTLPEFNVRRIDTYSPRR